MKTVWILFVLVLGFSTTDSLRCFRCMKQLIFEQTEAEDLILVTRPPCAVLFSAADEELKLHSAECGEDGCAKIKGFILLIETKLHYEFRGCYNPRTANYQHPAAFSTLPPPIGVPRPTGVPLVYPVEASYKCPQYTKVEISKDPALYVNNLTLNICWCKGEYCNLDPIYEIDINATKLIYKDSLDYEFEAALQLQQAAEAADEYHRNSGERLLRAVCVCVLSLVFCYVFTRLAIMN